MMTELMTQETPGKVLGLLAASVSSLMFLFAVTATNASFSRTEVAVSDPLAPSAVVSVIGNPFGPQSVMAFLDKASNSYSNFLAINLIQPATQSYASLYGSMQENYAWVMDNADTSIVQLAGLTSLTEMPPTPMAHPAPGSVAGAYTMRNSIP